MSNSATFKQLTLNPAWPHFVGLFFLFLGCIAGAARFIFDDPAHCDALLNRGSWLDSSCRNWQPDGCMLYSYNKKDASTCLSSKDLIFIGDSVARKLFFQMAQLLDSSLPKGPQGDGRKHSDHKFRTKHGTNITFAWDPFLNSSFTQRVLTQSRSDDSLNPHPPAMLVLGSGLWYLRYANASGGISAWESNMERIFGSIATHGNPADEVVILPVEQVVASKLSAERASTMHASDIDAMNSDLYHRINPPVENFRSIFSPPSPAVRVSLPLVFNRMLDETLTEDGLHFADSLIKSQANILLNLRCNDAMPKVYPFNKTCCNHYPWPTISHAIFLALVVSSGPFLLYKAYPTGMGSLTSVITSPSILPPLIISTSIALIYLADRTGFWLKEQKQFDPWNFAAVTIFCLLIGLATAKRTEKDMGFLNRDQTDEWKGWMQIAILVYHYFGASKVSGVYNPIRVLVASYLFMTGYGHTTFYLRKADYGFLRVAQVLIRLNLYTILLAYTVNTDYISYYFTPLVSMWYIIIYATMIAGARFNDRTPFLLCKILASAVFMTWLMNESWLLEVLFELLHRFCAIHWSSREWAFRVNLDIWIVYVGMLASIAVMKIREHRFTEHPKWPIIVKIIQTSSGLAMVWYFMFELAQESKFVYNRWHPYVSFLPLLAYATLRNSTIFLRSTHSRAFAFIGKCSLETFIIQFHFWLAGDSKGVLLIIPGTRWRAINAIITTTMFVYLCDRVAFATSEVTNWICRSSPRALPLPATTPAASENATSSLENMDGEARLALMPLGGIKAEAGSPRPAEPETPVRARRWMDRLTADGPSHSSTSQLGQWMQERKRSFGLKSVVGFSLVVLWVFNVSWRYPTDASSQI